MRTAIIGAIGYVAAVWVGVAILITAMVVVLFLAARRGHPLRVRLRLFILFLGVQVAYLSWLFALPAASTMWLIGFVLVGAVRLESRLRFQERHLATLQEARAQQDGLGGDRHA